MAKKTLYRQGDVILVKVDSIPDNTKVQPLRNGRVVLGFGEHSGNIHGFEEGASVTLMADDSGRRFVNVKEASPLVHNEHDSIMFEPGNFEVIQQREFDSAAARAVLD